jgi:hypothetical protein
MCSQLHFCMAEVSSLSLAETPKYNVDTHYTYMHALTQRLAALVSGTSSERIIRVALKHQINLRFDPSWVQLITPSNNSTND